MSNMQWDYVYPVVQKQCKTHRERMYSVALMTTQGGLTSLLPRLLAPQRVQNALETCVFRGFDDPLRWYYFFCVAPK